MDPRMKSNDKLALGLTLIGALFTFAVGSGLSVLLDSFVWGFGILAIIALAYAALRWMPDEFRLVQRMGGEYPRLEKDADDHEERLRKQEVEMREREREEALTPPEIEIEPVEAETGVTEADRKRREERRAERARRDRSRGHRKH
jgi:hypothetical protein